MAIPYKNFMKTRRHSESLNPRRIAVVSQMCINIGVIVVSVKNAFIYLVSLTFDISTQNHIISRISESSLYQVWTLLDHSFLSYAAD